MRKTRECSYCGCEVTGTKVYAKNNVFCSSECYSSSRRIPIEFIVTNTGCFECISHKGIDSYPRARINSVNDFISHHVYELFKGKIPKGKVVRHTCDNRKCINPQHLILGSIQDNIKDAIDRNRFRSGERHPKAILKEADIKYIRQNKGTKARILANELGVSPLTISAVKNNHNWKRVVG